MTERRWVRVVRSPWLAVTGAVLGLTAAVIFTPLGVAAAVVLLSVAAALIWRLGPLEGLWYLLLASIPFREPLSIDIHGTVSLFPTDVLLFGLLGHIAWRGGFRGLWRRSLSLRLGLLFLVLSLPGLFTATHLFWGIASVYRIAGQIALFVIARHMVRSGRDATRALAAIVVGFAPAVAYGLYQASLPFGAELPDWANHLISYGPGGDPRVRVFSTFGHVLHFSHYLSVVFGLALGLASSRLTRLLKGLLLGVGIAAAYCNLFTVSIAGTLASLSAIVTLVILNRRRRVVLVVALLLVAVLFVASPATLVRKAGRVMMGETTTAAARLVTYKQSLEILRDRPILGVGWGGIRSSLEHEYRVTRAEIVAFGAENYFLQRGMALGFPGLIITVALAVLFFVNLGAARASPQAASWPRDALLVGGIAFFVQAEFFPSATATSCYLLWLLFGVAESMRDACGRGPRAPELAEHREVP